VIACPECGQSSLIETPPPRTYLDAHCRACGYALQGLDKPDGSAQCPECGKVRETNEPDGPGVMPDFGMALVVIIVPMITFWGVWHFTSKGLPNARPYLVPFLCAAILWGLFAPLLVAKYRARIYAARPRIVFDEVAVGYVSTLLAAFLFGVFLLMLR